MSDDLFHRSAELDLSMAPLAERMRPRTIDEVLGQEHILGSGKGLRHMIERGQIPSMILWGPPGTGKTTLARLLATSIDADFKSVSAVMSGVKDLRAVVAEAKERRAYHRRRTILFVDEIHRFNKAQQDALLPHVEAGIVTLVGATTENPSFEVNAALLSRSRVFVLRSLDEDALLKLLRFAISDDVRGLGKAQVQADDSELRAIASFATGDARRALTTLDIAVQLASEQGATMLSRELVEEASGNKILIYDKAGEEHYNVVSALIKSLRGSDPDAAVYWMVRMLEAGESPRFILRRLVIFASEDIGNADPRALQVATSALQAFEFVGLPEGVLPMTQAVTYLATAPKSNAAIVAYMAARKEIKTSGALAVPKKLRNAPTSLMKNLGYGKDYKYPHNFEGNYVTETYLPDELEGHHYYYPSENGDEAQIKERLDKWRGSRHESEVDSD